jgi:hypothetical protein
MYQQQLAESYRVIESLKEELSTCKFDLEKQNNLIDNLSNSSFAKVKGLDKD